MNEKNQQWKYLSIFLVIILVLMWIIIPKISLNKINNNPTSKDNLVPTKIVKSETLRWNHMPLTYSFSSINKGQVICPSWQKDRLKQAFKEIQNKTNNIVSFEELKSDYEGFADLHVNCYPTESDFVLFMTAGGGNYTQENGIITRGELNFYMHINCGSYPDVELFSILEALGFPSTTNRDSIMSDFGSNCDLGHIDSDIIQSLIDTYSN